MAEIGSSRNIGVDVSASARRTIGTDVGAKHSADRLLAAGLLCAIAAYAVLYVSAIGPYWNISPDSATYVDKARSLAAGEGLGQPTVHPPMTSIAFAIVIRFAPDGYTALNVVTTLLFLFGLVLAFFLIRRDAGHLCALAAVLGTLAFDRFMIESTNLLSEPVYMVLSLTALLAMGESGLRHDRSTVLREALAAVAITLTVLTRTVGLALAAAVIVIELRRMFFRQPVRRVLLAGAVLSIAAFAAWEVALLSSDTTAVLTNWIVEKDRGAASGTIALPRGWIGKLGPAVASGGALLGAHSTGSRLVDMVLMTTGTLLVLAGLVAVLRRSMRVLPLYILLYIGIIMVHVVKGGFGPRYRLLVPVVPFLFYYAAEGVLALAAPITARAPRWPVRRSLTFAGVAYIAWLAWLGWESARWQARDQHSSPFGAYPIRRPPNYDVQRVAMRMREVSRPGDAYAGAQKDMHDLITERTGHDLLQAPAGDPDALEAWLRDHRVRYVLLDRQIPSAVARVGPWLERYGTTARVVTDLPEAALYERAAR